jgi:hypothetical protein
MAAHRVRRIEGVNEERIQSTPSQLVYRAHSHEACADDDDIVYFSNDVPSYRFDPVSLPIASTAMAAKNDAPIGKARSSISKAG